MPDGAAHVLGYNAKWDERSPEYKGTKAVLADIPKELEAKMHKAALAACRAQHVRDYARDDLRLSETQYIYVFEVIATCDLGQTSEFATGALAAGIDYPTLVNRIAELAIGRWAK